MSSRAEFLPSKARTAQSRSPSTRRRSGSNPIRPKDIPLLDSVPKRLQSSLSSRKPGRRIVRSSKSGPTRRRRSRSIRTVARKVSGRVRPMRAKRLRSPASSEHVQYSTELSSSTTSSGSLRNSRYSGSREANRQRSRSSRTSRSRSLKRSRKRRSRLFQRRYRRETSPRRSSARRAGQPHHGDPVVKYVRTILLSTDR
ncbi:hypothetical protein AB6A40_003526 [Gnathostoma spinigerum]|uniref:Uncharacterized protein n=1 Tax=Gnathostoma spinigerum TaxID=75299 RepID=A0ABD6EJF6_9BILA